jgi:hypothetical protein
VKHTITLAQVTAGARKVRSAWVHKRWVRVTGIIVGIGIAYSAGHQQGILDEGPRGTGNPGGTVTEVQLHGKWDGIGTLPDGTPFCLVGWPCEDLPEK